ncbi:hypothetical protein CaCOL14_003516 [Colletotrichum acutatum]
MIVSTINGYRIRRDALETWLQKTLGAGNFRLTEQRTEAEGHWRQTQMISRLRQGREGKIGRQYSQKHTPRTATM